MAALAAGIVGGQVVGGLGGIANAVVSGINARNNFRIAEETLRVSWGKGGENSTLEKACAGNS